MGTPEETDASDSYETRSGDVSGAVHTGRGDNVHVERAELAAKRAAARLRRALSGDDETRAQLLEVLQQLSALQGQLGEWEELHHVLHELLAAFAPFRASLRVLESVEAGPASGRSLLRGWRPCQTWVDRLTDFEGSAEYVQPPRRREGGAAARPDWGARIASLRREVEDRLGEEMWDVEGLIDLAGEFNQACDCYLSLAGRELRRGVDRVQRLYTHLLGGLL